MTLLLKDDFGSLFEVDIEPQKTLNIKASGKGFNKPVVNSFNMGDRARFDPYHLGYTGEIVSIDEKEISVMPAENKLESELQRIPTTNFVEWNWDFQVSES